MADGGPVEPVGSLGAGTGQLAVVRLGPAGGLSQRFLAAKGTQSTCRLYEPTWSKLVMEAISARYN